MIKKCAYIRSDTKGDRQCPFGLPITMGCEHAGNSVANMCPLKMVPVEKQEQVKKANQRVYLYHRTNSRCLYAADIIESKDTVNCDFGDVAAGMHAPAFQGSPLYAQTFAGVGIDGLYAFPLGFYADNNTSRNLPEGLFSLVSNYDARLAKYALVEDISDVIVNKLKTGENLTTEERLELENKISDCRKKFEDNRTDPAKADELARKQRKY